ncbi:Hsp70 family protein [Streptomyces tsukubensis]|uniref:Hsp70 family protein n=1 Tax=Streptomyces tsukubensis TaxID=83656 RepID=A0A1V4AAR7_9ACTN|nr:Hsp70 family protein [Streptomyces tsukubensis]OON80536.1 hypothetical protein B1H18_11570 [Streptomyces tsukubensis]QFR96187.1 Hsp70 family protein [Streptomyces tsukubensis]
MIGIDLGHRFGRVARVGADGEPAVSTGEFDVTDGLRDPRRALAVLFGGAPAVDGTPPAPEPDRQVVLGLPASGVREDELRRAAEGAGFEVVRVVPDAVAVALHYGAVAEGVDRTVLVCDQGATTLDLTVLAITPDLTVRVVGTTRHRLGGDDWDSALAAGLAGRLPEGADPRRTAELLRLRLGGSDSVTETVMDQTEGRYELTLRRADVERAVAPLRERALAAVAEQLSTAEPAVDTVLLAGGLCAAPGRRAEIEELPAAQGLTVRCHLPEHAVVRGLLALRDFAVLRIVEGPEPNPGRAGERYRLPDAPDAVTGTVPTHVPDPDRDPEPRSWYPRPVDPEPEIRGDARGPEGRGAGRGAPVPPTPPSQPSPSSRSDAGGPSAPRTAPTAPAAPTVSGSRPASQTAHAAHAAHAAPTPHAPGTPHAPHTPQSTPTPGPCEPPEVTEPSESHEPHEPPGARSEPPSNPYASHAPRDTPGVAPVDGPGAAPGERGDKRGAAPTASTTTPAEPATGPPTHLAVAVGELQTVRRGDHLLVLWAWPDGALSARVRWRREASTTGQGDRGGHVNNGRAHDGRTNGRQVGDGRTEGDLVCRRRVYEHDGGLDLTVGRDAVIVTVEALVAGDGMDREGASSLLVPAQAPVVEYEPSVRRRLKGRMASVAFTTETGCDLPALRIVHSLGRFRPTSTAEGTVLHEVPAQRLPAGAPLTVEFPLPATRGPSWLVCFPADGNAAIDAAVEIRPTALHRLRVT